MKLNKLKTFSSLSQKKKVSTDGRAMVLKADRSLFGRIIIIGQSRKIDVRELLQYSLGHCRGLQQLQKDFLEK